VNDKIPRQNEANRRAPISSLNSSQPRFEGAVGPESPSHGLAGPTTDYEEAIEEVHLQHCRSLAQPFPSPACGFCRCSSNRSPLSSKQRSARLAQFGDGSEEIWLAGLHQPRALKAPAPVRLGKRRGRFRPYSPRPRSPRPRSPRLGSCRLAEIPHAALALAVDRNLL
jgi:hypothetical protein